MIYTFDARGNIMWEVMTDHFKLTEAQVYREIEQLFSEFKQVLRHKGINYDDLKTALIPNKKGNDILLVFDSQKVNASWYGYRIFEKIIPLFHPQSNHSVLTGDYIDSANNQEFLFECISEKVRLVRDCNYLHSSQFYLVYINNITDQMLETFVDGLKSYEPFIGYADMTYDSNLKMYISFIIHSSFIKHRKKIIMAHETDVDNMQNRNICGFPFEENGYEVYSLQDTLYNTFLSYKIERSVVKGFERDTAFSLNCITTDIQDLSSMNIIIEEPKLEYLVREKAGILDKAGMIDINRELLERLIKTKIKDNYIFNLEYLKEYHTVKFNIILEFDTKDIAGRIKVQAALEYLPAKKVLRLITLY